MLEEKIDTLIASIDKLTVALAPLAKAAGGAAAAAGKPAGAAAGTKPAGAAAGTKPAGTKPAGGKPKAPTIDDIRAKFGGYLSTKDKDLRAVRLEQVAAINAHFGVAKASDLDPTLFAEALGYLAEYEAGREPEFAQADEATDEGDEGEAEESLV